MLIPDLAIIKANLKQAGLINTALFSDAVLEQKFKAAYAMVQRNLKVFLEPTEIIPEDAPQSEIDALEDAGTPYHQEAAYDYEPGLLSFGSSFGLVQTQNRPIIAVHSMVLSYPSPENVLYTIPEQWIRANKKHGQIQLVPTMVSFTLPFSAYLLQVQGGGSITIPFMLRIRYTAGLKDIETKWPDVVELVYRQATLNVLKSAFLPGSKSLSVDGFSKSVSVSVDDWQKSVDSLQGDLMDSIHGIRLGVL